VLLELTGPAGGRWALSQGAPVATVRADTVAYLRALSGRNDHPSLDVDGDQTAAAAVAAARVVF
jgi:MDMPI C-terminal domain